MRLLPDRAARPVTAVLAAALFAVFTGLVIGTHGRPVLADGWLHHWAMLHRAAGLTAAARLVTLTGTGIATYLLAAAAGACLGRRQRVDAALIGVLILVVGQAVRGLISAAIGRPPPLARDWIDAADGWAFPSSQTTAATIVAILFATAFTRPAARVLVALWAAAVALTGVYLGAHWPTDALGGCLFGITWAFAAVAVTRRFLK
ncbi:phosphatase PAP2 family protein [Actinomadura barringtoniae]|uniref:Phosphatase PAP2 family protein n=1 Tax=Actinomadura barringtoniae TaxID=1427535 RepID=A0A939PN95_9ACTN|nr:phosphatase PAP2 family protein [Actinomadura barringtoniae]MBO2453198.1 phosphatase PAP2 family protein [Actinomadura barringtoniae]